MNNDLDKLEKIESLLKNEDISKEMREKVLNEFIKTLKFKRVITVVIIALIAAWGIFVYFNITTTMAAHRKNRQNRQNNFSIK